LQWRIQGGSNKTDIELVMSGENKAFDAGANLWQGMNLVTGFLSVECGLGLVNMYNRLNDNNTT
jgi:hypothetical protein